MRWLLDRPFAHRGLFDGNAPENSLAAFQAAIREGYGIELDVRRTADREAVVFHDDDLDRLTDGAGPVAARTAAELSRLRLANGEPPPLLSRVLALTAGRVPLYVEIKNRGAPGPLEERVLALLAGYAGPFALASFNPYSLAWLRRRAPDIPRGQIACAGCRSDEAARGVKFLRGRLFMNWLSRPDFVAYDLRSLPNWRVERLRRSGLPVLAWTVRTPEDLAKARQVADNYVFERIRPDQA